MSTISGSDGRKATLAVCVHRFSTTDSHSYYPGTKGWEGTGVTPNVAVPAADALVAALTRLGVAPVEAARLSAEWSPPAEEMARRRPRRA